MKAHWPRVPARFIAGHVRPAARLGTPRSRIATVIKQFGLESFVDDLTAASSCTACCRTVFASGKLVHEPKVLIVDEPTVGLDPHSVRQLKDLLRRQADQGTTVFLSSHSLDIVEELADRMAIINHGRLISCGTLEALRGQASVDGSLEKVFLTLTRPIETDGAFFGAEADA